MPVQRPVLSDSFESNVPGLFIVGDLAGASVVKLAMEQGYKVAHHLAKAGAKRVVVVGAGCAGLNAASELTSLGVPCLVLEKGEIANTIAELPEGKWIYTEPSGYAVPGRLWLQESTKDDLARHWRHDARRLGIEIREREAVTGIERRRQGFVVKTGNSQYQASHVILAIGRHGTPRRLEVPGEDQPHIHHRLYNPNHYRGERILIVGGGNSAVEAAVVLAEQNRVTLSYRGTELYRISRENRRRLDASDVQVLYNSRVVDFSDRKWRDASGLEREFDRAFVLAGSDLPTRFLKEAGLRLENEWTAGRYLLLALLFVIAYTIYGVKQAPGQEFWPFKGWGAHAFSFFGRPWSFWYTVLYTALITIFGVQAMKRWGFDRKDRFQIWRYISLIGFQWVFFFLIPEFLFRWAVEYQWVGAKMAADPNFAQNAWRSYGLVYAWPLFFYTFFGNPHQVWIVWGALLSFGIIPLLALFHGKRYCSWICGCGGLAETLGDRWRHLAPKGSSSVRWERMNAWILAAAVVVTLLMVGRDVIAVLGRPADFGVAAYRLIADTWLVGIIPVALYPFFGGKIWCRYWCPLAKMMEIASAIFTRFRVSRFSILSNEKCIACGDCTRNCQVGIDVMRFALKQEVITNANTSCIGCGICVTVCPMHVLSFAPMKTRGPDLVQIAGASSCGRA